MTRRSSKAQKPQTQLKEFVILTLADDLEQAEEFQAVLKNNDIEAIIKEQTHKDAENTIALMVPEDFLDEAHVIIESQQAYDDFFELAADRDGFDLDEDELFDDTL